MAKEAAMVEMTSGLSDSLVKTLTAQEIVQRVEANVDLADMAKSAGLKPEQVKERLARDGPNCMTQKPPLPLWKRFGKHLLDPMLILLMIAGVLCFIAYAVNGPTDTPDLWLGVILFVLVFLTSELSFYQEGQAESIMNGFDNMLPQVATVRRGSQQVSVQAKDLVLGDVVVLETGDKVPADIALLQCRGLRADLSSMTGESLPVKMRTLSDPSSEGECIALSSSQIMAGNAIGVVIRTGDRCTIGMIANLANAPIGSNSTLRRNVEHFVKKIGILAICMAIVFFVISIWRYGTKNIISLIVSSFIVVLVANVPEGLPAAVSGCLAVAARRMADKKVLVKRLEVLDTLGAVTTICTDKTGTLTQNHMAVSALFYEDEEQPPDALSHPRHKQEIKSAFKFHGLFPLCFKNDPLHCTILFTALCNQATATDYVPGHEREESVVTKPVLGSPQTLSVGDTIKNARLMVHSNSFKNGKDKRNSLVLDSRNAASTYSTVSRFQSTPVIIDSVALKRVRTMPAHFQDNNSYQNTLSRSTKDALRKQVRQPRQRDVLTGNASDVAMFCFAELYLDVMAVREEIRTLFMLPFSSERKWMATIHAAPPSDQSESTSKRLLIVKGALERVMPKCTKTLRRGAHVPLTSALREGIEKGCSAFARKGQRVLVISMAVLPAQPEGFVYKYEEDENGAVTSNFPVNDLTLISCVAIHDPPKVGVPDAVSKCQSAGIRVIMITGDHPATAEAIARHCNIIKEYHTKEEIAALGASTDPGGQAELAGAAVVTGAQIDQYTEQEWTELLNMNEIVFARTSPVNKLQIVERLQKMGEIVAMTGDGVNDSPALRRADIGIAMGLRGQDVAREAADLVLMDDDFCTIVNGIEEGRLIFDNLRKIIAYTLAHLLPEVTAIAITLILGMPYGLNSFMILSIDLGTEVFPSLSLSYEEAEDAIMNRPPRDDKVDRLVSSQIFLYSYLEIGIPVSLSCIFAYLMVFQQFGIQLRDLIECKYFTPGSAPYLTTDGTWMSASEQVRLLQSAQSAFLATIVLSQFWHVFNVKTRVNSIWEHGIFNNRLMNAGVLVAIGLLVSFIYIPFMNEGFGTGYMSETWIWVPHLLSMTYITAFNFFRKYKLRQDLNSKFSYWFGW